MLFRVEKSVLQDSLEKIVRAAGKEENLNCVLIEVNNGQVNLTCTNIITTIRTSFVCMDFEDGEALIDSKFLLSYVKALASNQILVKTEENKVSISCGRSKSSVMCKEVDKFPKEKEISDSITVTVNIISEELKRALKETIFAAAHDETRPILTGILFEIKDGMLTLVGLDGFRMAVSSIPVDSEETISCVVPQKSALELQRLLENDDENVVMKISSNKIEFIFASVDMTSVPLEGQYISYRQIINDNSKTTCTINRQKLLALLNRASAVLTEKSKLVELTFSKEGIVTLLASSSLGNVNEQIFIKDFKGPELNIAFNLKYLCDMLMSLDEEELEFKLSNSISPVVINKKEISDYTGIVLPVRLVKGEN